MTDFRPPWAPSLDALIGIPVCVDPKVPTGTAVLDVDPEEPRHITRIRSRACNPTKLRFTVDQHEQIRDHYRAMDERAGRLLAEWQQLAARFGLDTR